MKFTLKARLVDAASVVSLLAGISMATPALTVNAAPTARSEATMQVGAVYLEQGYIVLDSQTYLLQPSTRVYRASGATGNLTDLRNGMYVTIRVTPVPVTEKPRIIEIKIVR